MLLYKIFEIKSHMKIAIVADLIPQKMVHFLSLFYVFDGNSNCYYFVVVSGSRRMGSLLQPPIGPSRDFNSGLEMNRKTEALLTLAYIIVLFFQARSRPVGGSTSSRFVSAQRCLYSP